MFLISMSVTREESNFVPSLETEQRAEKERLVMLELLTWWGVLTSRASVLLLLSCR